jgi:hypothetical protein
MASGGKREGAGRPRKEDNIVVSIRIHRAVAERIRSIAKAQRKTLGEVVTDAIMFNNKQQ